MKQKVKNLTLKKKRGFRRREDEKKGKGGSCLKFFFIPGGAALHSLEVGNCLGEGLIPRVCGEGNRETKGKKGERISRIHKNRGASFGARSLCGERRENGKGTKEEVCSRSVGASDWVPSERGLGRDRWGQPGGEGGKTIFSKDYLYVTTGGPEEKVGGCD